MNDTMEWPGGHTVTDAPSLGMAIRTAIGNAEADGLPDIAARLEALLTHVEPPARARRH